MQITRLFFLLLLTSSVCIAQEKKTIPSATKIYDEAGHLQMLIAYSPSCNCRTYTEFYTDGKIFAKRTFKTVEKGEFIDGEDINYYHDGSIKDYKLWKDALPSGRAYSNHDNGKLEHEEFYSGKFKSGTWKYYDYNGSLVKEVIYPPEKTPWNSKKDFARVRKYSGGKLVSEEVFHNGQSNVKTDTVKRITLSEIRDGKKLFIMRCAACHDADKDGYGPALKGVTKSRTNTWLMQMIANGSKLVESKDPEAVLLYNKWNRKKHMPERLDDGQIEAIIDYLKTLR